MVASRAACLNCTQVTTHRDNRANFDNPVVANRDLRLPSTFLVLTNLYGGSGFPRQAQLGMRFEF